MHPLSAKVGIGMPVDATRLAPFEGPVAAPEPTILQEIATMQVQAQEMAMMAIGRVVDLHQRLIGLRLPSENTAEVREGLRFSSDGQLGEAYHRAFELRDQLTILHRELDALSKI